MTLLNWCVGAFIEIGRRKRERVVQWRCRIYYLSDRMTMQYLHLSEEGKKMIAPQEKMNFVINKLNSSKFFFLLEGNMEILSNKIPDFNSFKY